MALSLFWQAVILALIQGVTELFPVSSLGHAVVVPDILGWTISQDESTWLPFLVIMHLGTAVALLLFFWRDWFDFAMAVLLNRGPRPAQERRLFWRVVVATIPALILGAALGHVLRHVFAAPEIACGFLKVNGLMLFCAERFDKLNLTQRLGFGTVGAVIVAILIYFVLRNESKGEIICVAGGIVAGMLALAFFVVGLQRSATKGIDALGWVDAIVIGLFQSLALIPGISRSGSTMVGGFRAGLNHEDAARFSFLTATPIILAATVFEAPKILKHHAAAGAAAAANGGHSMLTLALIAGVVAGIAAYASVWALMRWFKRHEFKAFDPFAYYCVGAGALALVIEVFLT